MEINTLEDFLGASAAVAAGSFVIMMFSVIGLSFFVALGNPPAKRALWTTGCAYLIAVAVTVFGGPEGTAWLAPIAAIIPALAIYAYLFWHYGRTWFDEAEGLPEGVNPAETDWRNGLLKLVALIVVATVVVSIKVLIRSAG